MRGQGQKARPRKRRKNDGRYQASGGYRGKRGKDVMIGEARLCADNDETEQTKKLMFYEREGCGSSFYCFINKPPGSERGE